MQTDAKRRKTCQRRIQSPGFLSAVGGQGQGVLKDFSGKWVVLYFYPKDSTSG